ncbi:MAG: hypothetical protein J5379_00010 [Clostridiales bacterium]|nr:hypothetical protein [Clostridiales bacterium]
MSSPERSARGCRAYEKDCVKGGRCVSLPTRVASALAAVAMGITIVPVIPGLWGSNVAAAGTKKDASNTCLGVYHLHEPREPYSSSYEWYGSYVWFGKYNGSPVKYRVLDPFGRKFGGDKLFLDCDSVLYHYSFDKTSKYTNDWEESDILNNLNNKFLQDSANFTDAEYYSVAYSKIGGGEAYASGSFEEYAYGESAANQYARVFLLDASDVTNKAYGYYEGSGVSLEKGSSDWASGNWSQEIVYSRKKKDLDGSVSSWWLRSYVFGKQSVSSIGGPDSSLYAGSVADSGYLSYDSVNIDLGVSPALNINHDSILMYTAVKGSISRWGTEYKLTLLDEALDGRVEYDQGWSFSGSTITMQATVNDNRYSRISVLVTKDTYDDPYAKILYYGDTNRTYSGNRCTVKFDLPSDLNIKNLGSDYHVYLITEKVNGDHYSDYASVPYEVLLPTTQITSFESSRSGIEIKWNAVTGFTRYNVYRSLSANDSFKYVASITDGSCKYLDTDVAMGMYYYYKVCPYTKVNGSTVYGTMSDYKYVYCPIYLDLTVTPKSGVTMRLNWNDVAEDAVYYIYMGSENNGYFTREKATTGTSTSITGLTAGKLYYFSVEVVIDRGPGYVKTAESPCVKAVPLATPTMESATYTSGKGVTLTWTKASGADRYNVYRYNSSTGKYDYVTSVLGGNLTYTDPAGKKGDYYKVRAYKKYDGVVYYGGWSNAKAGK